MKRKIAFRAWDKKNKRMENNVGISFNDTGWDIELPRPILIQKGQFFTYPLDNFELMQFTGLLDKNGKEIYEGDLTRLGIVVWINDGENLGFLIQGRDRLYPVSWAQKEEIIGNIYENPELQIT